MQLHSRLAALLAASWLWTLGAGCAQSPAASTTETTPRRTPHVAAQALPEAPVRTDAGTPALDALPGPTPLGHSARPRKPTEQQVLEAMKAVRPKVALCSQLSGTVAMDFEFAPDGKPTERDVASDSDVDPEVRACAMRATAEVTVPPFEQAAFRVRFEFPLGDD